MLKKTLLALTCLAVATSALAKEVTIPTARGGVTLDVPPAKIAVFDTGSLDTLQALGVKVDGAADVSKVLPYLKPTLEQAKNVGTIFEPNLEALNELKPDLIIVGTRTAKKFDDVSAIAKTIDLTDNGDKLIESGIQRIDSFGKLFNKQTEANKLKAELETLFKQTKEAVQGKGNGLIILVNGGKISAFGKGYRLSFIHEDLGVPMADPSINVSGHGQPVSFEFIEKTNPDWLFVLDRISAIGEEGKSAKEVLDNELILHTKAWKNGNIVYLSSASYLAPGGAEQLKMDLNNIKAAFEKK
ncbi:ABC transport system periplasmic protein [Aggregatibacter actinomycetemcomitans serotype e str. SC1083]|uniref:ABC transport system periplasmic protein n=1 Tax=Aggregatibacter actinomycetemcomitans serotype e str. SC1083 TaxID=907488 RepID=G4A884_AGGAC|nr:siderophore ABC transporter substrate-binding protein [Aggregatibacter actinomycetemcomitans]EGY34050.1 ABC transport system periplasmic protein [Aggregatibacter actinomycetemcomitans serotype e str. SC1083]KYK73336.1 enterochelin ABC transporter substrate-binding protein [Aggregatibacter actinomycetemcomitans serotype e str. SA3096]KYK94715.1 enterochelin ABC transporter substrate-binding protein [Aggregatibacter actinomycetemcomitans serotype e str. ANH9776]TYB21948.1 siderophore ABC trans